MLIVVYFCKAWDVCPWGLPRTHGGKGSARPQETGAGQAAAASSSLLARYHLGDLHWYVGLSAAVSCLAYLIFLCWLRLSVYVQAQDQLAQDEVSSSGRWKLEKRRSNLFGVMFALQVGPCFIKPLFKFSFYACRDFAEIWQH